MVTPSAVPSAREPLRDPFEVIEAADVAIWVTDLAGNVLHANPAALRMLGWSLDEVRAMGLADLFEPETRDARDAALAGAAPGDLLVMRRRMRRRDGSWVLAEGRARVLEGGRIVTTVVDVGEAARAQRALVESEQTFRAIFELAGSGKAQSEPGTGRFLRVNRKLCEIVGYAEAELLARTLADVTHPDDRAHVAEAMAEGARSPDGGWTSEARCVRKDGELRWVLVTGRFVRDERGELAYGIATFQDITERKRAEADARRLNDQLRDADRRKDEFLAVLSHELRNPLTPIANALQILDRSEPGSHQGRRALGVAARQVRQLTRLVDDLLDVTRIARGKVQLQRSALDLREIAARAAEDHRALLVDAGIALEVSLPAAPVPLDGDAARLAQVIGNLLGNAAKFTPRGGRVRLAVAIEGAEAILSVRDDGVGMDADVLEHLFQPFVQGERTLARTSGGLGLGLALVKGLVEMHGGSVAARSGGPGLGSELVVRLPVAAERPAGREAPERARAGGRRILVVDDNVDAAETLRDLLVLLGHEVELAQDGPEALGAASRWRPDVVLCDIGLPGMDGYEVARALRADPAGRGCRIVALSGYARPDDRRRALEAGFDAHVPKPPELDALQDVISGGG